MTNSSFPGEPCNTPPRQEWTDIEKWAWQQLCEGKIADFNEKHQKKADPVEPGDWTDERVLSSNFLETVLLCDPYKSALPHEGIRIDGAWIKDQIDLSNARLVHAFWLDNSRVENKSICRFLTTSEYLSFEKTLFLHGLDLSAAHIDRHVNMYGVKVQSELDLNGLSVGGSLFISQSAELHDANLRGANILGSLIMNGAKIHGKLDMNGISVGCNIQLRDGADLQEVDFTGSRVSGQLDMTGVMVHRKLSMNGISIGEHLFLDGPEAKFNDVDMSMSRIDGTINIVDARFSGELYMESVVIGQHLIVAQSTFQKKISLMFAAIGGNMTIYGTTLQVLDLTAACIKGDIALGTIRENKLNWREDSLLILRYADVGSFQDAGSENDVWPSELILDGFTYKRLGGFSTKFPFGNMAYSALSQRNVDWFVHWLEKDKTFSVQPYQQLAAVLQSTGNSGKAATVLYAAKQRERGEAFIAVNNDKWLGMCMLDWTIGYGFGYRYFRSLWWVAIFTLIGAYVLSTVGGNAAKLTYPESMAYSFNLLLPIVKLNEAYKITKDFVGWQLYYFYVHQIIGYLLGLFIIAGLSGITKK